MERRSFLQGLTAAAIAPADAMAEGGRVVPVVASFSILADMVQQIAGPAARVTSLVGPDGDPHVFEPTPRDLRAVAGAWLVIENGLGLEGWMVRLHAAAGAKGVRVVAAESVKPRTMVEGGRLQTDPHAWQDPANGVLYTKAIAAGLGKADPSRNARYLEAADRYVAEIRTTDAWIEEQFAPIPPEERRIITTHDAFGYYGARYGIELLAAEGLGTDAEPSARSLAALIAQIRREKIRAVFLENMTDPRIAQMLVGETGAKLGGTVYSDALSGASGPAPTYVGMLRYNTAVFAKAMRPA